LSENVLLQPLPPIEYPEKSSYTFQQALNRLDPIIDPRTALYLILRHNGALVAATYVPYLADAKAKKVLIENRSELIRKLGGESFSASFICKEIGEITDARSWNERDGEGSSWSDEQHDEETSCAIGSTQDIEKSDVKDLGFKKNRCRLCDRRMKNKIDDDALEAICQLGNVGDCVQLVSITTRYDLPS
jgi:twinfilin-like protein